MARSSEIVQLHIETLDGRILPDATLLGDASNLTTAHVIVRTRDAAAPEPNPYSNNVTPLGFGFYRVDLNAGVDAAEAVRYYYAQPDISDAAIDDVVVTEKTSNDPSLGTQWSLTKAAVTTAWNVTTGTGRTIVAVIDTGVDITHSDLAGNIWTNTREIPGNGRDDDGNGYIDDNHGYDFANNDNNPADDDGHGTHVAGIIGARGNNALGISGVNWSAQIMPLKFLKGDGTGYTSDAVRALNYAVANGARIVNMSWGGGAYNSALAAAIGQARTSGVIVVAAAGNNGNNSNVTPFYPASYSSNTDNMVIVGASTSSDLPASYSNYGPTAVTLFAPGSNILSLKPGNQYVSLSGTSMATPFVSGALSLLWDAHPTWNASQILAKLRTSVDSLAAFNGLSQTNGRINVAKLLDATTSPTVPPVVVSPPPTKSPPPPVVVSPPPATLPSSSTMTTHSAKAGSVAIPDFGSISVPIVVDRDAIISDLDLRVNIKHTYDGDLILKLVSPDGRSIFLANRRGGSGDNFTNTIFDDEANTTITKGNAPFSGTFKPEQSLSLFDGMNARGTWRLMISDNAQYDAGTLTSAILIVTANPVTATQVVRKQAFADVALSPYVTIAPPVLRTETRSILGIDL
ncbi:hypothetical protein BH11PLA2_BH11PLA2_28090 [soil metagenome]